VAFFACGEGDEDDFAFVLDFPLPGDASALTPLALGWDDLDAAFADFALADFALADLAFADLALARFGDGLAPW